jgi:uncharacterized UBP type Zn finger protein
MKFVYNLLSLAPEFGPLGEQQDAEECLQKLMFLMNKVIIVRDNKQNKDVSLINSLFDIEIYQTVSCPDLPDEKPKHNI